MDRLDKYGDNWRTAPLPLELDEPIDMPTSGQTSQSMQSSVKAPRVSVSIYSILIKYFTTMTF